MDDLLERLKLYEPLFGKWKVDFIAMNYEDMAWVYLKDDRAFDEEGALMKVKVLSCPEEECERNVYHLMMNYEVMSYPDLTDSSYLSEEHYYIENDNHEIVGVDVCLLSAISQFDVEDDPVVDEDLFSWH